MDRRSLPVVTLFSTACRTCCALVVVFVAFPTTASAHHLMGGKLPATAFEGLLSGLSHPVIGLDHFLVVLAVGMLSARLRRDVWIPAVFLLASLLGTGIHLLRIDLAGAQVVVAGSVLCFGWALAVHRRGNLETLLAVAFGAGIFHGYTYAESIVGAEASPLVAYLVGFTAIQLAVVLGGRALAQPTLRWTRTGSIGARALGTAMSLVGIVPAREDADEPGVRSRSTPDRSMTRTPAALTTDAVIPGPPVARAAGRWTALVDGERLR